MKKISFILAFLAACAFASPMATQQWTSNLVARMSVDVARSMLLQFLSIADAGASGDFITSNGTSTVSFVVADSNGVPQIVTRQYTMSAAVTFSPPYHGARIVSSSLPECPTGTLYACVQGDVLECKTLQGGPSRFNLGKSGGLWYVSTDVADGYDWRALNLIDRIQISKWDGLGEDARLIGTFSIVPHAITAEEFAAAANGEPGTNEWCATARNQAPKVVLSWTPVETATQPTRRTLRAGPSQNVATVEVELLYFGPGMVDYNATYPPPEGYIWKPGMGYPEGAWENPANWLPKLPIVAKFTDYIYGEPVVSTMTIPNETVWNIVVDNYDIAIPPYPYTYPQLVKKSEFECAKYGHVWGKGCICTKCGAKRDHKFEMDDPDFCAVCVNKLSSLREDEEGEYHVDDTDEICGDHETEGDESLHGGWRHEGESDPESQFYCACQCGLYGAAARPLAHSLEHKYYAQISGEAGQTQHFDVNECKRCKHEVYKRETHEVPPGESEGDNRIEYIDNFTHRAYGTCEKCEAEVPGLPVNHYWGYFGDGPEHFCKCPCQTPDGSESAEAMHNPGVITIKNEYNPERVCVFIACWRCGSPCDEEGHTQDEVDAMSGHYWAYSDKGDGVLDTDKHWCACGWYWDRHVMEWDEWDQCYFCKYGADATPGCDYTIRGGEGGADRREGKDSTTTSEDPGPTPGDPDDDTDDPTKRVGKGKNGHGGAKEPYANKDRKKEEEGDAPGKKTIDDPALIPPPLDPSGLPGGTVDPNVHRNDWQNVSAPYSPPSPPDLLPPDFR